MQLLLVAPPAGVEEWSGALADAGFDARTARAEDAAGAAAALRDPLDLVLAWDDEAGTRAASVLAAVRAEGAALPVAVVACGEPGDRLAPSLREGAAAVLDRDRPERLPAELGRILERTWLATRLDLTGRIAHDLNNLLAPIPLAVQLLERAVAPSAVRGQLASVQSATRRSMNGVKELSGLLAAEQPGPLRLRAKHLLALASRPWRRLGDAPPTVLTDYPPDLESVRVEPVLALQVLWCLARRSLDAGGSSDGEAGALLFAGRNVVAGSAAEAAGVELRVVWMPSAGPARRQDPDPVRAPEPADRLDAVLEAVAALGGSLSVVEAGTGRSGYALFLPAGADGVARRRGPDAASAAPHPSDRGLTAGTAMRSVLVIESDEEVRRMTRQTLEGSGWQVLSAADGTEGVALFAEHREALGAVLVDMRLPYLDGLATIKALRRIGGPVTAVLTTDGDGEPPHVDRADGGPDAVLRKPYDAESLLRVLGA